MSATFSAQLKAAIANVPDTKAVCFSITTDNIGTFRYTTHSTAITISGDVYTPVISEPSSVDNAANFANTSLNISGAFTVGGITRANLEAGHFDGAAFVLFIVDYPNPSYGTGQLFEGYLGTVEYTENDYSIDVVPAEGVFERTVGNLYSLSCRTQFGSAKCGIAGTWSDIGIVASSTGGTDIQCTFAAPGILLLLDQDDWFTAGYLQWASGDNVSLKFDIYKHIAAVAPSLEHTLKLIFPTPFAIQAGDIFSVMTGCRKRFTEDCVNKFDNGDNFQGEPFAPTKDAIVVRGEKDIEAEDAS